MPRKKYSKKKVPYGGPYKGNGTKSRPGSAIVKKRRIDALNMHLKGMTQRAIAEKFGLSVGLINRDIKLALKEFGEKPIQEYRDRHLAKLELLAEHWWKRAMEDEKSVIAFIKIQERISKLLGMEAAKKLEIKSPVKSITVTVKKPEPIPIQGEIVKDQKALPPGEIVEGELIE